MTLWVDVVARARGLRTHRLHTGTLAALRGAPDLAAFGRHLQQAGFLIEEGERNAPALDLAIRRRAATELRILARWCGARAAELPVILEEEDRRSLRAILRGSLQGQPAEVRLRGLVPTPTLPLRALAELARGQTPAGVATLLTIWNHPFARALTAAAQASTPDPLTLDLALDRAWAERAATGARRGGVELQRFATDAIDLANAATVLTLAGTTTPRAPELFLEGGHRLARTAFVALLARNRSAATEALSDLYHATPFGPVFRRGPMRGLDDALLNARVEVQRRAARAAPLGVAPVLWFALELRRETTLLSRMLWSLALGAPAEV